MTKQERARIARLEQMAVAAFARHEIRRRNGDPQGLASWFIGAPDSGCHAAEIVLCGFNSILIHGDCPDVLYCGGDGGPPLARLLWLARGDLDYISRKVRAGEKRTWEEGVAREEIRRMFTDRCSCDGDAAKTCAWCEARESILDDSRGNGWGQERYAQAIHDVSGDGEDCNVGWVVSSDVVYTRQAARRLIELEWPACATWLPAGLAVVAP